MARNQGSALVTEKPAGVRAGFLSTRPRPFVETDPRFELASGRCNSTPGPLNLSGHTRELCWTSPHTLIVATCSLPDFLFGALRPRSQNTGQAWARACMVAVI
eukprot:1157347-Pelagomonas_calceolata.AAC.1